MSAIYNYLTVSDMLACSGQPTEQQLMQLAANGYQLIINLGISNSKYSLSDEAASVKAFKMEYYHIPVVFDDPQLSELTDLIKFMRSQNGKKTLIHCAANYRASVFTGLYLFAAKNIDEQQMQSFIEDAWQPDAVWQQFIDDSVAYLKDEGI